MGDILVNMINPSTISTHILLNLLINGDYKGPIDSRIDVASSLLDSSTKPLLAAHRNVIVRSPKTQLRDNMGPETRYGLQS